MRRAVSFSAAGWEAVRFLLLFLVMTIQLNSRLRGETTLFLLWIAVMGLALAAALFLAGAKPEKYSVFVPLVGLLKAVQVLFGIVLVVYLVTAMQAGFGSLRASTGVSTSLPTISLIVGLDLLSALFLLLLSARESAGESESEGPQVQVTEIEEKK